MRSDVIRAMISGGFPGVLIEQEMPKGCTQFLRRANGLCTPKCEKFARLPKAIIVGPEQYRGTPDRCLQDVVNAIAESSAHVGDGCASVGAGQLSHGIEQEYLVRSDVGCLLELRIADDSVFPEGRLYPAQAIVQVRFIDFVRRDQEPDIR